MKELKIYYEPDDKLWGAKNEKDERILIHLSEGMYRISGEMIPGIEIVAELHGYKVVKEEEKKPNISIRIENIESGYAIFEDGIMIPFNNLEEVGEYIKNL